MGLPDSLINIPGAGLQLFSINGRGKSFDQRANKPLLKDLVNRVEMF